MTIRFDHVRNCRPLIRSSTGAMFAGGEIKLKYEAGMEQRTRLEMEGVYFRGRRVDMPEHQHRFRTWEFT